jgi:hypothetical protein
MLLLSATAIFTTSFLAIAPGQETPLPVAPPVTTAELLEEMFDLGSLARLADPPFRTVQFSSYDRRSVGPEDPDWFSNADGFGGEPIPGFMEVLEEPGEDGTGLYLVAEVDSPGAIVRGWSAGMGGEWKVYLDGAEEPVFTGSGYDFLARRTHDFLERGGIELETGDAFCQQDADYFPIPFSRSLRVTWRGTVGELHFYHLQVRIYDSEIPVETFAPSLDIAKLEQAIRGAVRELTEPRNRFPGEPHAHSEVLAPRAALTWTPEVTGSGAITELAITLSPADHLREALRGCLLRIAFDGSQRPQVEAPVGDFFGSGPGLNPFSSLPMTVDRDGTMTCRFVMPFAREVKIEVRNTTELEIPVSLAATISPWTFDESSLYFRARWRVDHELISSCREGVMDFPYLFLRGQGRLVGAATMVANPAGGPMASGNWWGEGDEKIFIDDEATPSTFGTGSEDFYNYSWSRCALFDHPFCGQPLDSGPATAGFVSNHRFFTTDSIPFDRFAGFLMELWQHSSSPQLSYAAIAYAYARPGALDDHRTLTGTDLVVSPMPPVEPLAIGGARESEFHFAEELTPTATSGKLELRELEIAPRNKALFWEAEAGETLTFTLPLESGEYEINFVGLHRVGGPKLRFSVDGTPLTLRDGGEIAELRADFAERMLNVRFARVPIEAGKREFQVECLESGTTAIDYFWVRHFEPPLEIPGALEGEALEVSASSPGILVGPQRLDALRWSGATHLWVQARKPGDFVELTVPVPKPGRYRLIGHFTRSYDYGIVQARVNGEEAGEPLDTFNSESRGVIPTGPIPLGEFSLEETATLRLEVVGHNEGSGSPFYFFGLDCVVLQPVR